MDFVFLRFRFDDLFGRFPRGKGVSKSAYFSHRSRCFIIFRVRSCSCLCSSSSSRSLSYFCSCSCSQPEEMIALMQARFFLS